MAHSLETKAQALALLILGNTPRYVSTQLGVPRTTVRRWQPEAWAWARDLFGDALAGALATIGAPSPEMALKKRKRCGCQVLPGFRMPPNGKTQHDATPILAST